MKIFERLTSPGKPKCVLNWKYFEERKKKMFNKKNNFSIKNIYNLTSVQFCTKMDENFRLKYWE